MNEYLAENGGFAILMALFGLMVVGGYLRDAYVSRQKRIVRMHQTQLERDKPPAAVCACGHGWFEHSEDEPNACTRGALREGVDEVQVEVPCPCRRYQGPYPLNQIVDI